MRASFLRVPVRPKQSSIPQSKDFPAPVQGWATAQNLAMASPLSCRRLDNFFPELDTLRLRRGCLKKATITGGGPVTSLFTFHGPYVDTFFAADETNIYDITSVADADTIPTASRKVENQTSGVYVTAQMGTAGGDFMYACNGDDPPLLYDGTDFFEMDSNATYALDYDAETANFTDGETLTGGTSGATATIVKVIDNGTDGTLWIKNIVGGPFQNNELVTDGSGGSADANIPTGVEELDGGLTLSGTGLTTSDLEGCTLYSQRLFFWEKGTLNLWYLAVDAIAGTLTELSLQGVFSKGGRIMFIERWSSDSGEGLDDRLVIVTSEGEVAIYQGIDPSSTSTWSLDGIFKIPRPKGRKGVASAGGDLIIATEEGIVALSAAIQKDPAALSMSAISRPIEGEWRDEAAARDLDEWELLKWDANNMLIVSQPRESDSQTEQCLVANLESGAWCRFTNWDVHVLGEYNRFGYFGTKEGVVYQMEVGGQDDGMPYTGVMIGQFDRLGTPGRTNTVLQARAIFRAAAPFNYNVSALVNYDENSLPSAPSSGSAAAASLWDVGLWDVATWDSGSAAIEVITRWSSIGRTGYAVAPTLQVTSGTANAQDVELVMTTLTFEIGGLVV